MKTLEVSLGDRSYPIHIGSNILSKGLLSKYVSGRQVMVVTNETIAPLYLETVLDQFSEDFQVDQVILPDGENYKSLDYLNWIFDALLENRHNRTTTLVALGGGVVGDMTGFAAACYQRGVDFIQVPTTVLSQVDSSVGGKTGVNHAAGKNMIGAFYQPNAVIIDTQVLATLPARELSAGLAEVIKYGLIYDEPFLTWLEQNMEELVACDQDLLAQAIYRSCEVKAEVVAQDEKEHGIRAWLNLGHTFGHAIETHQGYGNWLHGEAVASGTLLAAQLSEKLGWISTADVERTKDVLLAAGLPVHVPDSMMNEDFLALMAVDKKVLSGSIRLVLLEAIGRATVTEAFAAHLLEETLSEAERK